jgi:hypothetical protein
MGKIPIDYNKLRELGMKVLTESWFHPYMKIVQNLHLFLIGKEICIYSSDQEGALQQKWECKT